MREMATNPRIISKPFWRNYKRTGDKNLFDLIVESYVPYAKYLAQKIYNKMPSQISYDMVFSYGLGGLMEGVEKFDVERGYKFRTFAKSRIIGSIKDGLRSWSHDRRIDKGEYTLVLSLDDRISSKKTFHKAGGVAEEVLPAKPQDSDIRMGEYVDHIAARLKKKGSR